jgi:hypothetical protein
MCAGGTDEGDAAAQYADANKIYGQALSSVSSARAIADAVNPENVQEILQGAAVLFKESLDSGS